jgi:ATP-dependent helicase/DNAse subunit B
MTQNVRLAHSYSALKLFENCPQRYYRQRILKDIKDEGGEASKYGERVHEMLERRLKENLELPQEVAHYEALCKGVEKLATGGELHIEKEACREWPSLNSEKIYLASCIVST